MIYLRDNPSLRAKDYIINHTKHLSADYLPQAPHVIPFIHVMQFDRSCTPGALYILRHYFAVAYTTAWRGNINPRHTALLIMPFISLLVLYHLSNFTITSFPRYAVVSIHAIQIDP